MTVTPQLGFMVVGFVQLAGQITPAQHATLARTSEEALVATANAHPGFNPVGAMSELELEAQLMCIRALKAGKAPPAGAAG